MSDTRSHGWDEATDEVAPLPLCGYHTATTEHLSTFHANQISRQAPCCISLTNTPTAQ